MKELKVTISGTTEVGKTCLAAYLQKRLLNLGIEVSVDDQDITDGFPMVSLHDLKGLIKVDIVTQAMMHSGHRGTG